MARINPLKLKQDAAKETNAGRYEKAIELDPSRAFAYQQLGDLEAWDGRIDKALDAIQRRHQP